ncbi:MAG: nitrophenyl compound nitroreductase subunit ArsF family protein [Candidatus Omnitrophota bacterium]
MIKSLRLLLPGWDYKMNKGLAGILVVLILIAVVVAMQARASYQSLKVPEVAGMVQAAQPPTSLASRAVVYYFHGNARCPSCYKLEQFAKEAVEQNFASDIKTGRLVFTRVNVERSGNDHFVNDYQLYTKSVVISLVKNGKQVRYKNLDKVWDLLKDQKKYHAYVRDEIKLFLGEL